MKKLIYVIVFIFVWVLSVVYVEPVSAVQTPAMYKMTELPSEFEGDVNQVLVNEKVYLPQNIDNLIHYYKELVRSEKYYYAHVLLLNFVSIYNEKKIEHPNSWKSFIEKECSFLTDKLNKEGDNVGIYVLLSGLELNRNDFSNSISYAKKAININPVEYASLTGNCYLALNQFNKAENEYLTFLQKYPRNPSLLHKLSTISYIKKDVDKAFEYAKKLMVIDSPYQLKAKREVYWTLKNKNASDYEILSNLFSPEEMQQNKKSFDLLYLELAFYFVDNGDIDTSLSLVHMSRKVDYKNNNYYLILSQKFLAKGEKLAAKEVLGFVDFDALTNSLQQKYKLIESKI